MAQRYNSSPLVHTFNIGDLVSLQIDAKYRKSTPAKLFCKVFRKPQPDMHELECLHGIYPANIEQILNDYLHQLTCKLGIIQLELP